MAFVQRNGGSGDSNALQIQVVLSGVAAGNLIVVGVSWDDSGGQTLSGVSDDKGNTYTVLDQGANNDKQALATAYAKNVAGGTATITAAFSAYAQYRRIVAAEYSGLDTASPENGHAATYSDTASSTPSSPSVTPTVDGCTIIGLIENTQEGATVTAGSGYTMRTTSGAYGGLNLEDKTQGAAAAVAADWGFSPSEKYDAAVIAFKPAGAIYQPRHGFVSFQDPGVL